MLQMSYSAYSAIQNTLSKRGVTMTMGKKKDDLLPFVDDEDDDCHGGD